MSMNDQRGTVFIFVVIVMGVAGLAALQGLSRVGIDTLVDSSQQADAWEVRHDLFGCVDEALIQFAADEDYSATQIDIGDAVCNAVITAPTSNTREVVLTLTAGNITRKVQVEFEVDPLNVTRTIELP